MNSAVAGGRDSRALAAMLAIPAVAVVGATALGLSPFVPLAGLAGAGVALVVAKRLVRAGSLETMWMAAIPLSILAGHMSAISFGGQNGRLHYVDFVLAGGIGVALLRRKLALDVPREPLMNHSALLTAFGALSLVWARDPLTGIAELKEWLVMLAALAVTMRYVAGGAGRSRRVLALVAVTGACTAGMMAVVAATAPMGPVLAVLLKKIDLPWGRSNYLAGILILALPVALGGLGSAASARARLGWLVLVLANATGLALSASKGAILALVAGFVLAYAPAGRAARAALLLMGAVIAVGASAFLYGPLHQVLVYRMQASALAYSAGERYDLYHLAWESFLRRPLTGVGLNNFSVVANRLTGVDTVPHNFGLGFLAELGLIGTILAFTWLGTLLFTGFRAVRSAASQRERMLALGVWCALLAFALHNQLESTLYGEQIKVLLVLVAAAAWGMRAETSSECSVRA
jgi:O-antigen ligase